jgi:hypothetical protein
MIKEYTASMVDEGIFSAFKMVTAYSALFSSLSLALGL